jgi:hypothetical protein
VGHCKRAREKEWLGGDNAVVWKRAWKRVPWGAWRTKDGDSESSRDVGGQPISDCPFSKDPEIGLRSSHLNRDGNTLYERVIQFCGCQPCVTWDSTLHKLEALLAAIAGVDRIDRLNPTIFLRIRRSVCAHLISTVTATLYTNGLSSFAAVNLA